MRSTVYVGFVLAVLTGGAVACKQSPPPAAPAAPATAPAAPAAAADAGLAQAVDGRGAGPGRDSGAGAAAAPGAVDGGAADRQRFAAHDRANLRRHLALLAFTRKTRARWDATVKKLTGQKDVAAKVDRLATAQRATIEAQQKVIRAIDPDGTRSLLTTDHETNMQFLSDEYPAAIVGWLSGDEGPLTELRTEMDKVDARIEGWLREVREVREAKP